MPKLAAKDRKKVEKSEATSSEFTPMPPGKYVAELTKVEAKNSAAGNPMWVAEFDEIYNLDGEKQPGRLWYNLNLPTTNTPPDGYTPKGKEKNPEKAWESYQNMCAGRIKQFFEVFGYEIDSDTDEMIGERAVLIVGVGTISKGPRQGQQTNQVNGIASIDSVDFDAADADGDDDNF